MTITRQSLSNHVSHTSSDVSVWLTGLKEKKKNYNKKPKDPKAISWLFERFSIIWGHKWDKTYDEKPEAIAEEWTDALAGLSRHAIKQGLSKTRQSLAWPPTIAEFLQACQGVDIVNDKLIDMNKASEIAWKLMQNKLSPFMTKDEYFREKAIFTDLYSRIHLTQNEQCDFATCYVPGCYNYKIFDKPVLHTWHCPKHEGI